ncbi:fas-binding factor 1 homolog [Aplochiton taeniatus]
MTERRTSLSSKQKKVFKSSAIDDILGDLIGDDDNPKPKSSTRDNSILGGPRPLRSGKRSLLDDDFFSRIAEEAQKNDDDEDSNISEADPTALLENMKDIDEMDVDLFGLKKKTSSAPAQSKGSGVGIPKKDPPTSESKLTTRADVDNPLHDLLDDFPEETKRERKSPIMKPPAAKPLLSPLDSPLIQKKETGPLAQVPKKRDELTFDDDEDDLMDALGFGETEKETPKKRETLIPLKSSEPQQRTRTRLDEILGRGTSPHLLERPPTGEKKDQPLPQPHERPQHQERIPSAKDLEEDLTFGSYQPTLASPIEGRQSRRQSVRFSTEDLSASSPEKKPKRTTPATAASPRPRGSADWLGLKIDDEGDNTEQEEIKQPVLQTPKTPPSHSVERKPSASSSHSTPPAQPSIETPTLGTSAKAAKSEDSSSERKEETDDWMAGVLSKKKSLADSRMEDRRNQQQDSMELGEEVDLDAVLGKRVLSPASRRRQEDSFTFSKEPGDSSQRRASPPTHSASARDDHSNPVPQQNQLQTTAGQPQIPPQQVSLLADSLMLLQQQFMESQLRSQGASMGVGTQQRQKETEQQTGDLQALQGRIIQLEGQVRSLQLERDQTQMLLESVQQRHKQDTELMENTHRSRVKLLEESAAQREARARQEGEDLAERLATATRLFEKERAEMQAQQQRRLAQTQQDRDREVERLRELQRKSILEMKKDHEEQVLRLKRLKDEEVDAVTSATSQTRSLTVVIEQMEQFSHRLGDLSSRVESTHEHTAQGLEQGARQRDEQLRVMQDRLGQQQRAMAEERARLKEVIAKMDTQLSEQQRQLEKERWRVTAETAKAESSQKGLDEERRSMTLHITMEREELERAKSALLEEQQQVMQRCTEERRKLAAEWTQFHAQEKQRQERTEREASRALEREAQREGSIVSMAQEQAALKLRAGELRQKEEAAVREREALERQKDELARDKEMLSGTALRLKARAQEVEAFSKLASEKHEDGERALEDAKKVEREHQARLRSIHSQMERLRQQEQHLHQQRMCTTEQREMERMRQGLPTFTLPQAVPPRFTDFSSVLPPGPPQLASTLSVPAATSPIPGSIELQAKLALLRHTAEKDRDYLQDEQFFLDTLKKAPHNTAFHTD